MIRRFSWTVAALIVVLVAVVDFASAQSPVGVRLFEQHCSACHQGTGSVSAKATDATKLRRTTPEAVYAALAEAPPHLTLKATEDEEAPHRGSPWRPPSWALAEMADAKRMPNRCASNPPLGDLSASPMWSGWGIDPTTNARFQPAKAAGLTADHGPRLKLKGAFGFPGAEEAYTQPTLAAGRVFVSSDNGAVYSLDAATGCIYWSFQADAGMRDAIDIAPMKSPGPARYALYFGDQRANLYKVDAATGGLLWKVTVEDNPVAQLTGAPTLYEDRLYVPVSSSEERTAGFSSTYPCCKFRGSVVAVDAETGQTANPGRPTSSPEAPKLIGKRLGGRRAVVSRGCRGVGFADH